MQCSAAGRIGGFKAQSSGRSWVSLAHDVRTKAIVRLRAEARVRVRVWIRVGIRVRVRFGARVRVSKFSSDDPRIELGLMVVRARIRVIIRAHAGCLSRPIATGSSSPELSPSGYSRAESD